MCSLDVWIYYVDWGFFCISVYLIENVRKLEIKFVFGDVIDMWCW